jgi:4-hydroxy-3-polyprenylbenzoate decarboxylase
VTGASGPIYARLLVERLVASPEVARIALIFSDCGREVAEYEGVTVGAGHSKVELFDNGDMFAPMASGSSDWDAMVVIPCSMGTLGRIAAGVSEGLIGRAADVMLKERRRLILVPRETPLSLIHLRNMAALTECGAVIATAAPSFYSRPASVEELCMSVVERILSLLDIGGNRFRWGAETDCNLAKKH